MYNLYTALSYGKTSLEYSVVRSSCIAWIKGGKLKDTKYLAIDFVGTLNLQNKSWKRDYSQLMKLAYQCLGMKRVFHDYIFTRNGDLDIDEFIRNSINNYRIKVDPKIPYVFFLMLATVVRYAGENLDVLKAYKKILSLVKGRIKLSNCNKAVLFLLADAYSYTNKGFIIRNASFGHSLCPALYMRKNDIRRIKTIKERVDEAIADKKSPPIVSGHYTTSISLHSLFYEDYGYDLEKSVFGGKLLPSSIEKVADQLVQIIKEVERND